jgi:hypothetical protein
MTGPFGVEPDGIVSIKSQVAVRRKSKKARAIEHCVRYLATGPKAWSLGYLPR